jgi:hypothetical protein
MTGRINNNPLKKIWHDPVWSNVIAGFIVLIFISIYSWIQSFIVLHFFIPIILLVILIAFVSYVIKRNKISSKKINLKNNNEYKKINTQVTKQKTFTFIYSWLGIVTLILIIMFIFDKRSNNIKENSNENNDTKKSEFIPSKDTSTSILDQPIKNNAVEETKDYSKEVKTNVSDEKNYSTEIYSDTSKQNDYPVKMKSEKTKKKVFKKNENEYDKRKSELKNDGPPIGPLEN